MSRRRADRIRYCAPDQAGLEQFVEDEDEDEDEEAAEDGRAEAQDADPEPDAPA